MRLVSSWSAFRGLTPNRDRHRHRKDRDRHAGSSSNPPERKKGHACMRARTMPCRAQKGLVIRDALGPSAPHRSGHASSCVTTTTQHMACNRVASTRSPIPILPDVRIPVPPFLRRFPSPPFASPYFLSRPRRFSASSMSLSALERPCESPGFNMSRTFSPPR